MIPEWLSNIHPLVVHFPIALLVIAALLDWVRLFLRQSDWLTRSMLLLYVLGTVGLIVAYITGQQAIDRVSIEGDALRTAAAHEDWALYTTVFFLFFTPFRLALQRFRPYPGPILKWGPALAALIGVGLLWQTGERGAELVFRHGVAVQEVQELQNERNDLEERLRTLQGEMAPVVDDDGGWSWVILPGSETVLYDSFEMEGTEPDSVTTGQDSDGTYLTISVGDGPGFLLADDSIGDLEGEIVINLDDFSGRFKLVHHYQNPDHYQYLGFENGLLSQGQNLQGEARPLASETVGRDGWKRIRVTASGRHFYGYLDDETVTHTHADTMDPGRTGIFFEGSGDIQIRSLSFSPVND